MFRNYLIIALRNIVRHKLYSFINIAGLAVGLACVLFVMLFVRDELSYDAWLPDTADLYRVENTLHVPGGPPLNLARVAFPMAETMKDRIPQVRARARLATERLTITVAGRQFLDLIDVVDPNFLQVIKLPLAQGDPAKVLSQPESLVLSEATARKYFGDADPIGQMVTVGRANCLDTDTACAGQAIPLKVTGLLRDVPHNSQLVVNALLPNTSTADLITQKSKRIWTNYTVYAFVQLQHKANPEAVIRAMQPVLDDVMGGALKQQNLRMRGSQAVTLHLTPFTDVHLDSEIYSGGMTPAGSRITLYGVTLIGFLILMLACFNFMNLATARALLRAREISLRKAVGANRRQLIQQLLGEAVLIALLSLALALAIAEILLPLLGQFLGRPLTFHYFSDWPVFLIILAVALAAGLISGLYPAFVLSAFRPAVTLRANNSAQPGLGRLRGLLVVLQFSVSIVLGVAAIVVFSQISFARNMALGFRYDQVAILDGSSLLLEARESFRQTLLSHPGVRDVALSSSTAVPFAAGWGTGLAKAPGTHSDITMYRVSIDPDFAKLYSMPLVAGRMLSRSRAEDTYIDEKDAPNDGHNILVNGTAAARLGFTPAQAVGKTISFNNYHVHIVGVLADSKVGGARAPVNPTVYYNDSRENSMISVRVAADNLAETTSFIDRTWHAFAPQNSSRRTFLSDTFASLYANDERQKIMLGIVVGIAVFIACMGLFGLAAFTVGRRTKEIGIRKVFGARIRDVVWLLLWRFSVPVLIANLIAWPVAWYCLHGWLQGFAYRIPLSPFYFLGAGAVALVVAWVTVLVHALRVARANPIHALRYE